METLVYSYGASDLLRALWEVSATASHLSLSPSLFPHSLSHTDTSFSLSHTHTPLLSCHTSH